MTQHGVLHMYPKVMIMQLHSLLTILVKSGSFSTNPKLLFTINVIASYAIPFLLLFQIHFSRINHWSLKNGLFHVHSCSARTILIRLTQVCIVLVKSLN